MTLWQSNAIDMISGIWNFESNEIEIMKLAMTSNEIFYRAIISIQLVRK